MNSSKKEVKEKPLVIYIAEKLKQGYSPLSIEEVLEEKGYTKKHVNELIDNIQNKLKENSPESKTKEPGIFQKEIVERKIFNFCIPTRIKIKKFFIPWTILLFITSLVLINFNRLLIAKTILSAISLIFSVILATKFVISRKYNLKYNKNRLFEIVSIVSLAIFALSLFFKSEAIILTTIIGLCFSTYLFGKESQINILNSTKINTVIMISMMICHYTFISIFAIITSIFQALV